MAGHVPVAGRVGEDVEERAAASEVVRPVARLELLLDLLQRSVGVGHQPVVHGLHPIAALPVRVGEAAAPLAHIVGVEPMGEVLVDVVRRVVAPLAGWDAADQSLGNQRLDKHRRVA